MDRNRAVGCQQSYWISSTVGVATIRLLV